MPESDFVVSQQVPDELEPLSADEAFQALDDAPDDLIIEDAPAPPLGRSWAFDHRARTFVQARSGSPVETFADGTLRAWVEKCLRTDRGSSPIHPPEYGLERALDGYGEPEGSPDLADLEDRIREALTYHPRISDIDNYSLTFYDADEAMYVSFDVVTDDDEVLPIEGVVIG